MELGREGGTVGSSCVSPRYLQGVAALQPHRLWVPGAVWGLRALPGLLPSWVSTLLLQEQGWVPSPRLPVLSLSGG